MLPTKKLSLIIEGPKERNGYIRVSDFISEITHLISALKQTERQLHPSGGSIYYEIIRLSYASPAQIELQSTPTSAELDLREEVFSGFFSSIKEIQRKEKPISPISQEVLCDLAAMANPIGKTIKNVSISYKTDTFEFTTQFQQAVLKMLASEEAFPGFIRGMLEAINLHKDANIFRIYPDIGPFKITCHFPQELEEEAINAIGHFIEVSGILKYKTSSPYPHEIEVKSIQIFPRDDELPRFVDLKGIAPNATGSLSSEGFVRKLRDAAK